MCVEIKNVVKCSEMVTHSTNKYCSIWPLIAECSAFSCSKVKTKVYNLVILLLLPVTHSDANVVTPNEHETRISAVYNVK